VHHLMVQLAQTQCVERTFLTLGTANATFHLLDLNLSHSLETELTVKHFVQGDSTVVSYRLRAAHLVQGLDGGLDQIVGVGRPLRLADDVGHTDALKDSTHSTTSLHTGTRGSGLHNHARATKLGHLLVGDGSIVDGDLDEVLLGHLGTLGDSGSDLVGLAQSVTDDAITVAHDNDGCKGESTSTLGDLGCAVDGDKTILQFDIASLNSVILLNHDVLKFKSTFTGTVGQ